MGIVTGLGYELLRRTMMHTLKTIIAAAGLGFLLATTLVVFWSYLVAWRSGTGMFWINVDAYGEMIPELWMLIVFTSAGVYGVYSAIRRIACGTK